jgi:hypothetical protein
MKKLLLIILISAFFVKLDAQNRLLDNEDVMKEAYRCITSTYKYNFDDAKEALNYIEDYTSTHPVVPFLKGFIIYWEYFPITPGHEMEQDFLDYMEKSIIISEEWVKKSESELEAVFFDLFSRAFFVMYWADNGKTGQVFPHLNTMYKHVKKGFEMQDNFNEFYFTSGLYNYYIEAYPEKHPAFKPIVAIFQKGDKSKGLKQLNYCAENAVFLRVEAKFFLALLYLNYEIDFKKASEYAAELYREFPRNSFFTGKYLEIMLFDNKFFLAPLLLKKLNQWKDPFSQMQYHLYRAYYLEKFEDDMETAQKEYHRAMRLSEEFGDFTTSYNAIAMMGLGRCHMEQGEQKIAERYFRRAKNATSYEYIYKDF